MLKICLVVTERLSRYVTTSTISMQRKTAVKSECKRRANNGNQLYGKYMY